MEFKLLHDVAALRPEWNFILIGDVKVDESLLPRRDNIYYLGRKEERDLPKYMASWNLAMLPFALAETGRGVAALKAQAYLAAGIPVVSTSIPDIVYPYAHKRVVHVADDAALFVHKAEYAAQESQRDSEWLERVG